MKSTFVILSLVVLFLDNLEGIFAVDKIIHRVARAGGLGQMGLHRFKRGRGFLFPFFHSLFCFATFLIELGHFSKNYIKK